MGKAADGRSTIIQRDDGWHGYVSFGTDPATGRRRRKHVRARSKSDVAAKVAILERQREGGYVGGPGTTVANHIDAWVAARSAVVTPNTLHGYVADVRRIKAVLGRVKLAKLTPEHVEALWRSMLAEELSPGSIAHCRRTLSAALQTATDRGYIARNPVRLAATPKLTVPEVVPLSTTEARQVLDAARGGRNPARWSVALGLGLRQGEALGLRWRDLDLGVGTLTVRHQLQWLHWQHGCPPDPTGSPTCRLKGQPDKAADPGRCPRRVGGGPVLVEPKGSASHRRIDLPAPLVAELRAHRKRQAEERLAAGGHWEDWDLVFATANGGPLQQRADWQTWTDLLASVSVEHRRLHDARHTAATVLLVMGVDLHTVGTILGHSDGGVVTRRYAHVVDELRADAARRMGDALWSHDGITSQGR